MSHQNHLSVTHSVEHTSCLLSPLCKLSQVFYNGLDISLRRRSVPLLDGAYDRDMIWGQLVGNKV